MRRGARVGPETPVYEHLAGMGPFANPDPRKALLTVAHLMTHTSGLACDDNDEKSPGNEETMSKQTAQPDWWKYTLDLPQAHEPGVRYAYCSANSNLVGAVLKTATKTPLPELFDRWVARPLDFGRYYWNLMPTGDGYLGGGAFLKSRDLLKVGQAYLDGGVWRGRRIVDAAWVERSSRSKGAGLQANIPDMLEFMISGNYYRPDIPRPQSARKRIAAVLRESKPLISIGSAARALHLDPPKAAKILARWAKQGRIRRLRRGVYTPVPLDSLSGEAALSNPWVLVPRLFSPGYVGGWSAAEHWHLTEQIFRDVCVFTSRPFRHKRQVVDGTSFSLHRVAGDHLFGLSTIWDGSAKIEVSDPERTLIDMLNRPSVGGGIRHVASCLREYLHRQRPDLEKLIRYGDTLRNGAVYKRLGYLVERADPSYDALLEACRGRLTKGTARLDPALSADRLVTRWRLWVPSTWARKPQ